VIARCRQRAETQPPSDLHSQVASHVPGYAPHRAFRWIRGAEAPRASRSWKSQSRSQSSHSSARSALPAFGGWIAAYQLSNHARHLAETITCVRTEAMRRGQRVNLCKSPDLLRCADTGSWGSGFIVHVDADRDGQIDDGETRLASDGPAPPGITVQANRPLDAYVSFTDHGHARMLDGALQMGTFVVCRRGQQARNVVLSAGGRVRVETAPERCP
jgi:type IV fimbrial biogenesis protein FimT